MTSAILQSQKNSLVDWGAETYETTGRRLEWRRGRFVTSLFWKQVKVVHYNAYSVVVMAVNRSFISTTDAFTDCYTSEPFHIVWLVLYLVPHRMSQRIALWPTITSFLGILLIKIAYVHLDLGSTLTESGEVPQATPCPIIWDNLYEE